MRAAPLLVLLGLAVATRIAGAECAAPSPAMFPLGDQVPPGPVLYRFEPMWTAGAALRIEGPAGPVPFTTTDVSTVEGMRITAIQVSARRGWFIVHAGEAEAPRRFEVAALAPYPDPEVQQIEWLDDAWSCSHTTGLAIDMRAAGVVAFRASWPGHADLVPPLDRAFFMGRTGGEIDPAQARAFLGHPSCVTDLIDPAYIGRRDVDLVAIYADGSERTVVLPRKAAAPPPAPVAVAAAAPVAAPAAPATPVVLRAAPATPWWIAGAGVIGAVITVVLVLMLRRRRGSVAVP